MVSDERGAEVTIQLADKYKDAGDDAADRMRRQMVNKRDGGQ